MPTSEAQKRAVAKYNREKTKTFQLRFYKSDMDLLEHIKKHENQQGYVKDLIRADLERTGSASSPMVYDGKTTSGTR